jgi:membrane fusion protein, multidrug efflux system
MFRFLCLGAGVLTFLVVSFTSPSKPGAQEPVAPEMLVVEVAGRTQCILTRKCLIAPVPLHPVTDVLVEPGSRVKKGQALIKLDDDEAQADVRAKQAALECAELALQEARRRLAAAERPYRTGALPEQTYYEFRVAALKAEKVERAAKALLDSAKAELEHYEIVAQINGVVSWLNVHPGMVSRPGTTVWGEILDLREIDVHCALTLEQVEQVGVGQTGKVMKKGRDDVFGTGRVVFVGIAVDSKSGLVPVHLRLLNPDERLRSEEGVHVPLPKIQTSVRQNKPRRKRRV